jgi:hypothetical protein
MHYGDISVSIVSGEQDEHLDKIIYAIKMRRKDMAPSISEFQVGDRVKIVNANPKYINGSMATIKKINRTKVVIDLDNPNGRFYTNITTPLSMIEKV